jgi:hypothetical protein
MAGWVLYSVAGDSLSLWASKARLGRAPPEGCLELLSHSSSSRLSPGRGLLQLLMTSSAVPTCGPIAGPQLLDKELSASIVAGFKQFHEHFMVAAAMEERWGARAACRQCGVFRRWSWWSRFEPWQGCNG